MPKAAERDSVPDAVRCLPWAGEFGWAQFEPFSRRCHPEPAHDLARGQYKFPANGSQQMPVRTYYLSAKINSGWTPMNAQTRRVFVTGGTGYVGRPLIKLLVERGHQVQALVRPGSEGKVPAGCQAVQGDALDGKSYAAKIAPADTFVQLV